MNLNLINGTIKRGMLNLGYHEPFGLYWSLFK
jgi:hypothetical protein